MKPRNWRTYYGYRRPTYSNPARDHHELRKMADAYLTWLASRYGGDMALARKHVAATRPCGLISARYGSADEAPPARERPDALTRLTATIQRLPLAALKVIQAAIDARTAGAH